MILLKRPHLDLFIFIVFIIIIDVIINFVFDSTKVEY